MLGLQYYRLKNGYRHNDIGRILGISGPLASRLETDADFNHPAAYYLALSDLYGVSIEELLSEKPDDLQRKRVMKKLQENNTISRFILANCYTIASLGKILGVSKQYISKICSMDEPPAKYIAKLAKLEGISVTDFEKRYGKGA